MSGYAESSNPIAQSSCVPTCGGLVVATTAHFCVVVALICSIARCGINVDFRLVHTEWICRIGLMNQFSRALTVTKSNCAVIKHNVNSILAFSTVSTQPHLIMTYYQGAFDIRHLLCSLSRAISFVDVYTNSPSYTTVNIYCTV